MPFRRDRPMDGWLLLKIVFFPWPEEDVWLLVLMVAEDDSGDSSAGEPSLSIVGSSEADPEDRYPNL
eukprot:CAMPEP_0201233482 /NCGR_PEP_ID=MMETSP0852-20130820/5311_1 /ASSEMBLY_ACC=CAM_ASM_000632 /TAXON_ID=183588 /ORGANISM="Pseudo-nitzschia fraudulenta, Strain WWA7" /LENGTH=66 /DNA_ID=CAMNT_0047526381 /DNA_START=405 /DNA_END=605 /DNA_ORIENTATION=+